MSRRKGQNVLKDVMTKDAIDQVIDENIEQVVDERVERESKINDLINELRESTTRNEGKRIRRKLRELGHRGGLRSFDALHPVNDDFAI